MAGPRTYSNARGMEITISDPCNITAQECLELAKCGWDSWNKWRSEFPAYLSSDGEYINCANFHHSIFRDDPINFSMFDFGDGADFSNAKFQSKVNFNGAQFGSDTNFSRIEFRLDVGFFGAQFGNGVRFIDTYFLGHANFLGVQFGHDASFDGAKFCSTARFGAQQWTDFYDHFGERFEERKRHAEENGLSPMTFLDITFGGVEFDQGVSFAGRNFDGAVDFSGAKFSKAPRFHGCRLHQDINFDGTFFPQAQGNNAAARAYRTLKLAFAQQQAIREEQRFFKLEMQEEAARETGWLRWLYRTYSVISDFGFSISRPLVLFVLTTFFATLIYADQAGLIFDPAGSQTAALVQFSIASAIPGLEKLAEPAGIRLFGDLAKGIANYNVWVVFTLLAHKAASLLALFLIGLALRNLFKMK